MIIGTTDCLFGKTDPSLKPYQKTKTKPDSRWITVLRENDLTTKAIEENIYNLYIGRLSQAWYRKGKNCPVLLYKM